MRIATKIFIIAVAILINGLILGGFLGFGADAAPHAAAVKVRGIRTITLAPINVYPSAAERARFGR
ncbi:MAG TPA: hypothetical protein VFQ95_05520 [Rhodanobacteraceae bacterium]|nr:hypothetical protein [Rhodanobacteraceae bacterium]